MKNIPAFPTPAHNLKNDGMTLRDYFAAKAMQSLFALDHMADSMVVIKAYEIADAMLEQRNQ